MAGRCWEHLELHSVATAEKGPSRSTCSTTSSGSWSLVSLMVVDLISAQPSEYHRVSSVFPHSATLCHIDKTWQDHVELHDAASLEGRWSFHIGKMILADKLYLIRSCIQQMSWLQFAAVFFCNSCLVKDFLISSQNLSDTCLSWLRL